MRGRVIILVVSLLVVTVTLRWLGLRESGPRLKGNSVEEWLVQYGEAATQGPMREEAAGALQSLGTNIIPAVMRAINYVETQTHARNIARLRSMFIYLGIEGLLQRIL